VRGTLYFKGVVSHYVNEVVVIHLLESIPTDLRDSQAMVILSGSSQYTKTLGIEWNTSTDHFRVKVTDELPPLSA